MKTTAFWILAGIFGVFSGILGQINHLTLSIWSGVLSICLMFVALIVHNQETKIKKFKSVYEERTKRGDKEILRHL